MPKVKSSLHHSNQTGPDKVICPFDKSHIIQKGRMQVHITKCRRNHPDTKKVRCTFNTCHWLEPEELKEHQRNCPERSIVEDYFTRIKSVDESSTEPAVSESIPASTENWDDFDHPSYDPKKRAENSLVVRSYVGNRTQKKAFREAEEERLTRLAKLNNESRGEGELSVLDVSDSE